MYIPKRYGQSQQRTCPFCGKVATVENTQGVPVCVSHRNGVLPEIKCMCGKWLELLTGKWGPYFRCINCGNVSYAKGIGMMEMQKTSSEQPEPGASRPSRDELVVRSDDPRFFE